MGLTYIHSDDPRAGMHSMSARLRAELEAGKNVLWLICGGSNIPTAAEAMNELRASVDPALLANLTVAQTDERYGPVGHPDSNWKQMQDVHFNWNGIKTISILTGEPLEETVAAYARALKPVFEATLARGGAVIGQFGLGEDGHIAGILPHSPGVHDTSFATGYESEPFTRISLSFPILRHVSAAYVFAFGKKKQETIQKLMNSTLSLDDEPAQILKEMPEAYLYSDMI